MLKRIFAAAAVIIFAGAMVMISAKELPRTVEQKDSCKTVIKLGR